MATPAPDFTVAIPTCNGAGYLAETLDAVLAQDGLPFDLIVSDDRSDDATLERVRARAGERARIVVNDTRLGLAGNWNRCVELCNTPFLAIVHQDDVIEPGHLAAHLRAFRQDERIGLVASASTTIDAAGREVPSQVVDPGGLGLADALFEPGTLLEALAGGNPLRCSAVSLRVEAHRDIGGFDPALRYVLDWDFWWRVSRRWRVAWQATPSVKVRWHAASETHRFKVGRDDLDETRRMLDRLLDEAAGGPHAVKALRDRGRARLARAFLNRAYDALHAGQTDLARDCLHQATGLSPRVVGSILSDPRLALQMAALRLAPGLAGRWFSQESRHRPL